VKLTDAERGRLMDTLYNFKFVSFNTETRRIVALRRREELPSVTEQELLQLPAGDGTERLDKAIAELSSRGGA
jgi:hypothetical protein